MRHLASALTRGGARRMIPWLGIVIRCFSIELPVCYTSGCGTTFCLVRCGHLCKVACCTHIGSKLPSTCSQTWPERSIGLPRVGQGRLIPIERWPISLRPHILKVTKEDRWALLKSVALSFPTAPKEHDFYQGQSRLPAETSGARLSSS